MLTKYIRGRKGNVIGAVVATGKDRIGWCLVHPKDQKIFSSKFDVKQLAVERAIVGNDQEIPKSLLYEVYQMKNRAEKYFKEDSADLENTAISLLRKFCEDRENSEDLYEQAKRLLGE